MMYTCTVARTVYVCRYDDVYLHCGTYCLCMPINDVYLHCGTYCLCMPINDVYLHCGTYCLCMAINDVYLHCGTYCLCIPINDVYLHCCQWEAHLSLFMHADKIWILVTACCTYCLCTHAGKYCQSHCQDQDNVKSQENLEVWTPKHM